MCEASSRWGRENRKGRGKIAWITSHPRYPVIRGLSLLLIEPEGT
jgi:hypothetical protein